MNEPSSETLSPQPSPLEAIRARAAAAWQGAPPGGTLPRIEDQLAGVAEADRLALLQELVVFEVAYRRQHGEQPGAEEYRDRFPELPPAWLERELGPLSPTDTASAPGAPRSGKTLRCPHCQNPIHLCDAPGEEVLCPGCGGSFRVCDERYTDTASTSRPLGRFQLLERVGQGAFGAVWKARDPELDRIVALKILHSGLGTDEDEMQRFGREARATAQLRHPGIVTVHEVLTLDGLPVLVCDFVQGVTLKDFLEVRRLTFRESAQLVAELAVALDYAHSMGVIHRDLKPANVMLEAGGRGELGRPLLMDFGMARREEAEVTLTLDGHVLGTPAYMSPEQAAGKSHLADRRSDVYSLGVVLYELLAGELPFRGSKGMILYQVLTEDPRPPRRLNPRVPRDLETICLTCLRKEPEKRYASAAELAADLVRYQHGEPIQARPVGRLERAAKWVKRNPALTGAALAVVLALAVGTLASYLKYLDAEHQKDIAQEKEEAALKEAEKANKANKARDFLVSIFKLAETDVTGGNITVRQILAEAEKRIPVEFADQPELRADLITSIETVKRAIARRVPQAMLLEVRGRVQLQSATGAPKAAVPQALVHLDDRLSLSADAQVQLVFLSDLHKERLKPGRTVTVESKGCEPTDAVLERDDSVLMTFVPLPKGSFYMGWDGRPGTAKKTEIKEGFEIAVHDVTQGQWQAVMGNNRSWFSRKRGGRNDVLDISDEELKLFPVELVSWDDAQEFIKKLNEKERGRGYWYRLPTEAEWEYACRGGATSEEECSYHFYFAKPTNDLSSEQANFCGAYPFGKAPKGRWLQRTTRVGAYPANKLGLCDMHGNVWQWCADGFYTKERAIFATTTVSLLGARFGQGPLLAASEGFRGLDMFEWPGVRVMRGGCWRSDGAYCQAAIRSRDTPANLGRDYGIRLARVPVPVR